MSDYTRGWRGGRERGKEGHNACTVRDVSLTVEEALRLENNVVPFSGCQLNLLGQRRKACN